MRRTSVFVGIILGGAVMSLCGCATVRGTAEVNIDQSSPQALAVSLHDAAESRNFAAML